MATDGFVSAFHQVDQNDDGIISTDDLQLYCDQNQLKPTFVQKWLTLFDDDSDGIIHYDEFCRALGVVPKRNYKSNSNTGSDEVKIHQETDMSAATQDAIIKKIYREGAHSYQLDEETIRILLKNLDVDHGPAWKILVNPSDNDVKCSYDFDGKLYYTPNTNQPNTRLLVWRCDTSKKAFMCCC